jgi:putative Mg2+ transporter-C (MgtC) family protein
MLLETEALIRLGTAVAVGLLIGFTRRRKAAGIRTFALICLGCAIFTTISIRSDLQFGSADPTRIISAIVTGIGFLGLGVIWRSSKAKGKPVGLTTAATVWVTAAIGVLIGLGSWFEALVATLLTMGIVYYHEPSKMKK